MAKTVKAQSRTKAASTKKKRTTGARRPTQKQARGTGATTVMGVTIPKTLTNILDALVNSPRGREILASAIIAAASAGAAALTKRSDKEKAAKDAVSEVGDKVAGVTKDLSEIAAGALGEFVTDAARALLPASAGGTHQKK